MEIDGFLRRGAEALPVDGGVLTALLDVGDVALLGDGDLPSADFAPGGRGIGTASGSEGYQQAEAAQTRQAADNAARAAAAFVRAFADFGRGLVAVETVIEDDTIDMVHGVVLTLG